MLRNKLAAAALGLLVALPVAASAQGMGGSALRPGGPRGGMHGDSGHFLMLLKSANLTAAQEAQVHLILNNNRAQMQSLHQQLMTLHEKISNKLLGAGTVTSADLKPLVDKASRLEATLKQNMTDTALSVRNVLTPAQVAKLADVHAKLDNIHQQIQGIMGRGAMRPPAATTEPSGVIASDLPPFDIAVLVTRAADGERRAAEQLILLYQQRVARFVIAQTGDGAHYEDLCQTIFVKMVLALPKPARGRPVRSRGYSRSRAMCAAITCAARQGWRRLFVSYDAGARSGLNVRSRRRICPESDATRNIDRLPDAQQARSCVYLWEKTELRRTCGAAYAVECIGREVAPSSRPRESAGAHADGKFRMTYQDTPDNELPFRPDFAAKKHVLDEADAIADTAPSNDLRLVATVHLPRRSSIGVVIYWGVEDMDGPTSAVRRKRSIPRE